MEDYNERLRNFVESGDLNQKIDSTKVCEILRETLNKIGGKHPLIKNEAKRRYKQYKKEAAKSRAPKKRFNEFLVLDFLKHDLKISVEKNGDIKAIIINFKKNKPIWNNLGNGNFNNLQNRYVNPLHSSNLLQQTRPLQYNNPLRNNDTAQVFCIEPVYKRKTMIIKRYLLVVSKEKCHYTDRSGLSFEKQNLLERIRSLHFGRLIKKSIKELYDLKITVKLRFFKAI